LSKRQAVGKDSERTPYFNANLLVQSDDDHSDEPPPAATMGRTV
jgi:hypothetical protein